MIIGVGTDFVDIRRIERALDRFGERFLCRLFTAEEQRGAERVSHTVNRAAIYAKRFAAKEACVKALGTGISCGIIWHDLVIAAGPLGQPTMHLTGKAARRLMKMTPTRMVSQINITVSDEYPFAQAFVVISATPRENHHVPGQVL